MKSGFRHVCLLALALVLFTPGVFAVESPGNVLKRDVTKVLAVAMDESLDRATRRVRLSAILAARFDVEAMAQSILAVNWSHATPGQRAHFVELLTRLLEETYIGAIESYTTETVRVGGERIRADGATVIVTIVRRDGTDIPLLFKLRKGDGGWRAYDANIEGVSLVSNYRGSFAEVVKNRGIEGLLEHLEQRLAG